MVLGLGLPYTLFGKAAGATETGRGVSGGVVGQGVSKSGVGIQIGRYWTEVGRQVVRGISVSGCQSRKMKLSMAGSANGLVLALGVDGGSGHKRGSSRKQVWVLPR